MRGTAIAGAALAFVVQSVALIASALWAAWRLHQWYAGLTATQPDATQPDSPTLHIVGTAPRAPWVIYRDDDTETAP